MRLLIAVITAAVVMLAPAVADAHAHLDHASPPVGATVPTAPPDVTIWFTQKLEAAFSGVDVTRAERRQCNCRRSTDQRQYHEDRDQGRRPGRLSRALARRFRGHAQDRRQFHVHCGRPITCSTCLSTRAPSIMPRRSWRQGSPSLPSALPSRRSASRRAISSLRPYGDGSPGSDGSASHSAYSRALPGSS